MQQVVSFQHGDKPNNTLDTTGLCLLSLDGGGVRGLSTLYILKTIMDRLNYERKTSANLPPVKPCEVFDLIGGTSTGGLIAIMLGRLEMDVDECIAAYSGLAAAVFSQKSSRFPVTIRGQVKPRFDSTKLEEAIRTVITQSGASETDLLNDGTERGCRTFVCTADRDTKDIIRLRSYSLPEEPNICATILQAALATSAATTFFEPVSIGNRTFADGGLGANNPVGETEGEATNIWCSETGDLKPLVKCFISIGTGNPGKKAFDDSIIKFLGETIVDIATETENTERRFVARWARHFDSKQYFRFNVDQGLQDIGLDEYKRVGAMEAATSGYITHTTQRFRVRDCVQNMRLKQNKHVTSFALEANVDNIIRSSIAPTSNVTAIIRESGKLDLFIPRHGKIYTIWRDKGSDWKGVSALLGDIQWGTRIAAVARIASTLDLFVCDMNGDIWNCSWSGWAAFEDPSASFLEVVRSALKNPLHIWKPGQKIGNRFPAAASVSAISRNENTIDVFACGRDGKIYTTLWVEDRVISPENNAWERVLGEGDFSANSHVTITRRSTNSQHLFSCDKNGVIRTTNRMGCENWPAWSVIGEGFQPGLEVVAVSRGEKDLDAFACREGKVLWRRWTETDNWGKNWEPIEAQFRSLPKIAVATPSPNELNLFTFGTDGYVHTAQWTTSTSKWSDWKEVGHRKFDGTFMDVKAVCLPYQALHLFLHTINGPYEQEIWHISGHGENWDPWKDLYPLLARR